MTKRECAIIMAYTGFCMLKGKDFDLFYEYLKEIMGRPIFTHEIPIFEKEIKKAAEADFLELCRTATDEGNEKERIHDMIDAEIKKLQPPYKHIGAIKLLESIKEKI